MNPRCTTTTLAFILTCACAPLPGEEDESLPESMPADAAAADEEPGPVEEDLEDELEPDDDPPPDDDAPLDDFVPPEDEAPPDDAESTEQIAAAAANDDFEVEMTFTTANIGRDYNARSTMRAAFDRIGDAVGPKSGPKFIGWQEISEADPCGSTCEIHDLRARFKADWGWQTRRPLGGRPNGSEERVKVPVTSKGANDDLSARARFASPAWRGVSPTRFVTVVHYPSRNLSVLNTHFIAGAWSCKANAAQRRDYWRRAWSVLKDEVAKEHDRGRNVIVTGDLNRPRGQNNCNPAWEPRSLHPRARVVGGAGIDYIFAIPASGYGFEVSRRADGSRKRGVINIGIDGHKAHWVTGRFQR